MVVSRSMRTITCFSYGISLMKMLALVDTYWQASEQNINVYWLYEEWEWIVIQTEALMNCLSWRFFAQCICAANALIFHSSMRLRHPSPISMQNYTQLELHLLNHFSAQASTPYCHTTISVSYTRLLLGHMAGCCREPISFRLLAYLLCL